MLTVAVDTGPLYGSMTGVGRAVIGIIDEFRRRPQDIDVVSYVVSKRAQLEPGTRRLPYPAAIAMAAWSHFDHPRPDRHLAPARVVHGTNYVVPPVHSARLVSVYDTWALRHPHQCSPVVARAMNVLRRNIRTGAVVHASSQATADHVREIFPSATIHVIHLGSPRSPSLHGEVTHDRSRDLEGLIGSDGPYLLMVGTIERRKNFPQFIRAFARTHAARSGIRLVLAGAPGDDVDEVQETIDSLDSDTRRGICVLGRVREENLESLYRHAEAVAYPSLDEGFGFPVLEAMSHGIAVLASNRGSIPEIAGDAAILFDPADLDAMGSAIDRALFDSAVRHELRRLGPGRCASFSWTRTADELIDLYRVLADRGNSGFGA